jgi:hypothetical protein
MIYSSSRTFGGLSFDKLSAVPTIMISSNGFIVEQELHLLGFQCSTVARIALKTG